jgi:two-component system, OmpR family, phosphate regulon response regulator PhoB
MAPTKILIVEDDQHLSKLLTYNLQKNGYGCLTTISGEEALRLATKEHCDLIILDVMLPRMDGFQVCKELKADPKTASIPVIMLTARGEEVDRVVGLELGADDYVVKPFSVRELLLRVRNILKRDEPTGQEKEILEAGGIVVNIPGHKVTVKGIEVFLTAMEFKLLVTLLTREGRVQTRDQLLNDVWGIESLITTRTVDTHIKSLRQKLGNAGKIITTVRGLGYRLSAE